MVKAIIKQSLNLPTLVLACTVFLLLLSSVNSLNAKEIDLSTPEATFKSCMLELFDKKQYQAFVTQCVTREAKIDIIKSTSTLYLFMGALTELSNDTKSSKLESIEAILDEYGSLDHITDNHEKFSDAQINQLAIELLIKTDKDLTNQEKNEIEEVTYSGGFARASLVDQNKLEPNEYLLFFKKTERGWLIHEKLEHDEDSVIKITGKNKYQD